MTASLSAAVVRTAHELAALAPVWWDLWRRVPDATPFTSPAWLVAWQQAFAPGPLATVAVRRGDTLVALAPLWREDGPYGRRLLPLGLGVSDLFDWLIDPGEPDAAAALAGALAGIADWTILSLEELPEGAAALAHPAPTGWRDAVAHQSARPVLALGGGDASPLPARKRRKLAMARHRTERRGGQVEAVGPGELDGFLADLVRLHGARWEARGEPGVLADPALARFHALALPALLEAGLARPLRLTMEGRVVGAYHGLADLGRHYAYLGGFDPAFAFESPGTVLLGAAIDGAVAEGATAFDFLRGQEPYKYEWGAVDGHNRRRILVRP